MESTSPTPQKQQEPVVVDCGPLGPVLADVLEQEQEHWRAIARKQLDGLPFRRREVLKLAARMRDHYERDLGAPDNPLRSTILGAMHTFPFAWWADAWLHEAWEERRVSNSQRPASK